jgi:2-polyprenyl-6-methoxyphenol hydroxylase-like FAD-dependent oxidoreductase
MPSAVVSGLGPNGMLAALTLHSAGYTVTAVEQRQTYARTIHLGLRQSYLDHVRWMDAALHDKLVAIASPIERFEHRDLRGGRSQLSTQRPALEAAAPRGASVAERLAISPRVHVRLDELERVFATHLAGLADVTIVGAARLSLEGTYRFTARAEPAVPGAPPFTPSLSRGAPLSAPDLVVIAEGGKSSTARQLGLQMLKLSRPKFYLSVHVDHSLGPVTRRLDAEVSLPGVHGRVPVSFWANGHGAAARGTWLVLEIPEALHAGKPSRSFDREYYEKWSGELLGLPRAPDPSTASFTGTFRFEQQLLPAPVVGENLIFFGDAAGMGHHALGTGLELGACDADALLRLATASDRSAALARYQQEVVEARAVLLAFGLKEYYPHLAFDPLPWVHKALQLAQSSPGGDVRVLLESFIGPGP